MQADGFLGHLLALGPDLHFINSTAVIRMLPLLVQSRILFFLMLILSQSTKRQDSGLEAKYEKISSPEIRRKVKGFLTIKS